MRPVIPKAMIPKTEAPVSHVENDIEATPRARDLRNVKMIITMAQMDLFIDA